MKTLTLGAGPVALLEGRDHLSDIRSTSQKFLGTKGVEILLRSSVDLIALSLVMHVVLFQLFDPASWQKSWLLPLRGQLSIAPASSAARKRLEFIV